MALRMLGSKEIFQQLVSLRNRRSFAFLSGSIAVLVSIFERNKGAYRNTVTKTVGETLG